MNRPLQQKILPLLKDIGMSMAVVGVTFIVVRTFGFGRLGIIVGTTTTQQ